MAKKSTKPTGNTTISSDYLVYLSTIPFLLPLLYCLYKNSMTYTGGWYVSWSIAFILLLSTVTDDYSRQLQTSLSRCIEVFG